MATKYWTGRAASVAQVTLVTYSTVTLGEEYSITINGKKVEITLGGAGNLATLITSLVNAWSASGEPEHQQLIASDGTIGVLLTATTAGVPSTISAASSVGTQTIVDTVSASGPNFWNVAANWSGSALPSAADDLILSDSSVSILYGLTDTNDYTSLTIESSYTGAIGLPPTNSLGYPEYRTQFLTLGAGGALTVNIGAGTGQQAERIYLDVVGSNVSFVCYGSRSSSSGTHPVQIKNPASGSTCRVYGGSVLFDATSSGTITTLDVIGQNGSQVPSSVFTTSRITLVTATVIGSGSLVAEGSTTTLVCREGGQATWQKAAAAATVKVGSRGVVNWDSSGGITTKLHVETLGKIDFSRVGTTKTVAACDCYRDGQLDDSLGKVTYTAGIVLVGCGVEDVNIDVGISRTLGIT